MPKITLTALLKIQNLPYKKREQKIKSIIMRGDYEVVRDYYKQLRETIVRSHKNGESLQANLDDLIENHVCAQKRNSFAQLSAAYLNHIGKLPTEWFSPPSNSCIQDDFEIKVRPNLGLKIFDDPYLVKFYFDQEPLKEEAARLSLLVMEKALRSNCPANCRMGILDIRRQKFFLANEEIFKLELFLNASLVDIGARWRQIEQEMAEDLGLVVQG